ncbi:hypothetical protein ACJ41O_012847 [Fusarium nematophilum]
MATKAELPPRGFFVGNEFVEALNQGSTKLTLINPYNDTIVVDDVPIAGRQDADLAVLSAQKAFREGAWASFTGSERAACLNKFADLVEKNVERLAYAESLPTGRPIVDIIHFDLAHMVQVFRCDLCPDYAGWADKIAGQSFAEDNGFAKIVKYQPLGVCASIASWNATFMYVGWKLAPALAAGNTVIFKPSEKSPLGTLALAPLFAEAGFPVGVVQVLTGDHTTGTLLSSHMGISKISFTGSIAGGKAVQEAATRSNLKKVTLELGGKSPAIVFDDADFEEAVDSVAGGFLANCGQICVVLVHDSIADKFITAVKAVFESVAKDLGRNPQETTTTHGPVVDKMQFDRIMSYIDKGKQTAQLVTGGNRKGTKGCFIEPTLFVNPEKNSPVWREEVFGPVVTVKIFRTEEEAIELANDTQYGLAACVYTTDLSRALRISSALESGGVSVNSPYLPELNTPFGGTKQSGNGRELGIHGLFSYLEPKSVHIKTHAAMMDPSAFIAAIFVEPILFAMKEQTENIARLALRRRDAWPSKAAVAEAFQKSASLKDWDKRQLQVYIEHGTTDTNQDGSASKRVLKTPKEQEAATYLAAPHPEILDLLKKSNGRHHFIWGSNSKVISAPDRASVDKIIQPPSTSHTMPGAGHLIPMTHPETLSSILGTLIIDIAAPSPPAKL